MRLYRIFGKAFLVIAFLSFPNAGAVSETFEEALARAYLGNPSLEAGRAQRRATDEGVPQALGGWRPSVTITYEAGKNWRKLSGSTVGSSNRNRNLTPRTARAVVSQSLYDGGQTRAAVDGAEAEVLAQRARLVSTEQDVLFDAGSAYVDVVRDEAVLKLNLNNEAVLRRQLEATRDRFEVGEVTRTDVSQAESRFSGAVSDRINAEGQLANSRAAYRNIVGDFPGTLGQVSALGSLPQSQDAVVSIARDRSPAVMTARFEERSAAAAVKESYGELLPSLDIEGGLSRADEASTNDSRTDSAEIFATITIPLYQSGTVSSEVREAKQRLSQRRKELDAAVRQSIEDGTKAWENLMTAKARIKALSAEIKSAEIALDGVKQEAQVGSRTVLDVLDAEQELLDARVTLVRAQRDEVVASMELHRAVGTLTAKDMKLPVTLYDPTMNYRKTRDKWWGPSIDGE